MRRAAGFRASFIDDEYLTPRYLLTIVRTSFTFEFIFASHDYLKYIDAILTDDINYIEMRR